VDSPAELSGGNLLARWDRLLLGSSLAVTTYYDRTRRVEPTFRETRDTFNIDVQDQFKLGAHQKVPIIRSRVQPVNSQHVGAGLQSSIPQQEGHVELLRDARNLV